MPKTNDLETKSIIRITELLKKVLKNKELLEDILNKLQPIVHPETKILALTNNMISFQYPNGDTYSLIIDSSGIESYYSLNSQGSFQKKSINFLNNLIVVSIEESQSETDELTTLPSSIKRFTKKQVYKDNEIVYERMYNSIATASLNAYTSQTESEETYVNPNRIAYRRSISISNDEYNIPKVTYSKCYSYNVSPFNNILNTEVREKPFFVPSNENEYTVYTLALTKQEPSPKK